MKNKLWIVARYEQVRTEQVVIAPDEVTAMERAEDNKARWCASLPENDQFQGECMEIIRADEVTDPAQQRIYKTRLKWDGNQCPYCRSKDIEGGPVDVEENQTLQTVTCNDCNAKWIEVYRRTHFIEVASPAPSKKQGKLPAAPRMGKHTEILLEIQRHVSFRTYNPHKWSPKFKYNGHTIQFRDDPKSTERLTVFRVKGPVCNTETAKLNGVDAYLDDVLNEIDRNVSKGAW